KLFILNGTFSDGFPGDNDDPSGSVSHNPLGWDATSVNDKPGKQIMRASYFDTSPSYVKVEIEGEQDKPDEFKFYKNSYVYWFQDVTHSPTETEFFISFSYLYGNGPIGTRHYEDFQVRIEVDDGSTTQVIWQVDPTTLSSREVWHSVSPFPLDLTGFAPTFEIRLVLEMIEDRTFEASRPDFDGDLDNGLSVTLPFIGSTPISGTMGTGSVLVNHSYWDTTPIQFSLSSTIPISFDYEARFVNVIRFLNSTISTNSTAIGVSYTIDEGESPSLQFYSYVPVHTNYEGFAVHIFHSEDYENATVHNPFSVDVTSQVTISPGHILIDEPVTDTIGWWLFSLEAPNYLEALGTQVFNESLSNWYDSDRFLTNDRARARIALGYGGETPDSPQDIEVEWYLPNGTQWFSEGVDGDNVGNANSSGLAFGQTNSTPGIWSVVIFWENGSVIAYDESLFQVHHATSLLPAQPIIDAQLDTNVTGAVTFTDIDNGEILLDVSAEVVGNWSSGFISFSPNLAKGWWEADFDTSLVGIGNYSVLVNASLQFYENSSCTFEIHVTSPANIRLLIPDYSTINLGESFIAKFRYEFLDGTGIEDAIIEVNSWTGSPSGLGWMGSLPAPGEPGNYSIEFNPIISGQYQITVRGVKAGINDPLVSFIIDVGYIGTQLTPLNATGITISITDQISLAVQYQNASGFGLSGADVSIASIIPSIGLNYSTSQYHGNGTYSILLTPTLTGTYTLHVEADLINHEYQTEVFTLSVTPLATILTLDSSTGSIAVDRNYTVLLHYTDEGLQGLENASVSVLSINPATGVLFSDADELGSGNYTLALSPQMKGVYTIILRVTLQNYLNGTIDFTLVATDVPTNLRTPDGQSSAQIFFSESYEMLLIYERTDITANITGATIEINLDGLLVNITESPQGYILDIQGNILGTRYLIIKASKPSYGNATLEFELTILRIPSTVGIVGSGLPAKLYYNFVYIFSLFYNSPIFGGVTGAEISLLQSGISSERITWGDIGNGYYNISIHPDITGDFFLLSLSISKEGYNESTITFEFEVSKIETDVPITLIPDSFRHQFPCSFAFFYNSSLHNGVDDANIEYSPILDDFAIVSNSSAGWYNFTLLPLAGNQGNITISFEKDGYERQTIRFPMNVTLIPLAISQDNPLEETVVSEELIDISLRFTLIASDTGELITNAVVTYNILNTPFHGEFVESNGVYSAQIEVPSADLYVLLIEIRKENCISISRRLSLVSTINIPMRATTIFGPPVILIGVAIGVRRVFVRRKKKRSVELFVMKKRFEDVKNILGFLVIFKGSGLPIFSKVLKGGFEEGMMSGFITAITNFASEIRDNAKLRRVYPISEVVTAYETENLIYALITVDAPSDTLVSRLEELASSLGDLFELDSQVLAQISQDVESAIEYSSMIDTLFFSIFDEILVSQHVLNVEADLPRRMMPIRDVLATDEDEKSMTPEELVDHLIVAGLDEMVAYSIVLEAMDLGLLQVIYSVA
ncbi:MAG: hypothetical protein ACW985_05280, partial [Candidatus Thorarchaeota archaeon]